MYQENTGLGGIKVHLTADEGARVRDKDLMFACLPGKRVGRETGSTKDSCSASVGGAGLLTQLLCSHWFLPELEKVSTVTGQA